MPKIYTKTGDMGETGLGNGKRISKDSLRIEAIGAMDEANAFLGLVSARGGPTSGWQSSTTKDFGAKFKVGEYLKAIQKDLFILGTIVSQSKLRAIFMSERTEFLEEIIDTLTRELPPLTNFILPGGSETGALIHVARAVARRAERRVVSLMKAENDESLTQVTMYLNRLSDFLFTLARCVNMQEGIEEEKWCM